MNDDNKIRANKLLEKYKNNKTLPEEEKILENWFRTYRESGKAEKLPEGTKEEVYIRIRKQIGRHKAITYFPIWKYAAASIILLLGVTGGLYFYNTITTVSENTLSTLENDVQPGRDRAKLVLADGSILTLDNEHREDYKKRGVEVDSKNGIISFENYPVNDYKNPEWNTVRTENAGEYTILLPDGSKVKLNANSSLSFPLVFSNIREVILDGEAYFEVAKHETSRFIVDAEYQQVEVLGTQFNIKSYKEEKMTTTSLVSGSLRVTSKNDEDNKTFVLKPGDVAKNGLHINLVLERTEPTKVKAWRDGVFYFDGENLEEIMSIISRWYDVKVRYTHKPATDVRYGGIISRDKKLSTVLNLLTEKENLKFEIKGKEVIVSK